jgi:tetratricopeptide (TPR) repeat protein
MVCEQSYALTMLGRWDEALAIAAELAAGTTSTVLVSLLTGVVEIHLRRGTPDAARELLRRFESLGDGSDLQSAGAVHGARAAIFVTEGRYRDALAAAEHAIAGREALGLGSQDVKQSFRHALEAALALGEPATAERLLAIVEEAPPGLRPPFLAALAHRFRGRLAGELPEADRHFAAALAQFRTLNLPFDEAVVALEYAEWLEAIGRRDEAEPLRASARETFERLGAVPWLERADAGVGVTA